MGLPRRHAFRQYLACARRWLWRRKSDRREARHSGRMHDRREMALLRRSEKLLLSRVPLDGSSKVEPVAGSVVPNSFVAGGMTLSADGKVLAYILEIVDAQAQHGQEKLALLDLGTSAPRLVDVDQRITQGGLQYTPDGKAVAYPISQNGVDNLMVQPLDGSARKQITNFTSERISSFAWSPDGKSLGVLRNHSESDVVLLQEGK